MSGIAAFNLRKLIPVTSSMTGLFHNLMENLMIGHNSLWARRSPSCFSRCANNRSNTFRQAQSLKAGGRPLLAVTGGWSRRHHGKNPVMQKPRLQVLLQVGNDDRWPRLQHHSMPVPFQPAGERIPALQYVRGAVR